MGGCSRWRCDDDFGVQVVGDLRGAADDDVGAFPGPLGVNALIPSLTQTEARRHYERYVAPYFTADGRHDPTVAAQGVVSVAEELGVSTVPDTADIYRTEPAEGSGG